MLAEGEPDDPPRPHVQHTVEVELALVGGDLGAVAVPLAVELRRRRTRARSGPVPATGPGPAGWSACGAACGGPARPSSAMICATVFSLTRQPSSCRSAVIRGRAVAAAMRGEQPADRDRQLLPPGVPRRGSPCAPLVEPGLADPQRPARGRMRNLMLGPLGGDEPGHRYRPIASFTQRATERLSTSRCIRSSAFSFRSRTSSARSHSLNAALPSSPAAALPGAPVAQRALVDAQLPGHLRDRLPGLEHHPHRALPEVLIELPILSLPSPSSSKAMSPRYEGKPSVADASRRGTRHLASHVARTSVACSCLRQVVGPRARMSLQVEAPDDADRCCSPVTRSPAPPSG